MDRLAQFYGVSVEHLWKLAIKLIGYSCHHFIDTFSANFEFFVLIWHRFKIT